MLELKEIKKDYKTGDVTISALKGISVQFRDNEFVSILGPSGCGKTTLLNIVGGLDQYTTGDLVINGRSTKDFRNEDWDSYRNHTIGFIFQSYNLIPHQTVLSNVELALTLSGVSRDERRSRAIEALEQVGLGDQLKKKPNQMSGGQMQRVAIARALVNNPDILLADEPTGALDSTTSVQIMDLLKAIARDRLVIMVTHNPELAKEYSSRIIRLLDGRLVDDTNPYTIREGKAELAGGGKKEKGTSMSFKTAFALSLNNLMTKKGRTFMVAFAGSIGIIGIALVLSLSSGVQDYIIRVEEDTLSGYPLSIESASMDIMTMMTSMLSLTASGGDYREGMVYSNNIMSTMLVSMMSGMNANDLAAFKTYIESDKTAIQTLVSDIQYGYATTMNIYLPDTENGPVQINPSDLLESLGMQGSGLADSNGFSSSLMSGDVWTELLGNQNLLSSQYEVVAGQMPAHYDEVVVITNKKNEISDYALYTLGLKDPRELGAIMEALSRGEEVAEETETVTFTYDELLDLRYKLVLNTDYFMRNDEGVWSDRRNDEDYVKALVASGQEIKVVGIIRPREDTTVENSIGGVGYTSQLMNHLITAVNDSEIAREQLSNPDINVFTGLAFRTDDYTTITEGAPEGAFPASVNGEGGQALPGTIGLYNDETGLSYNEVLATLGISRLEEPSAIHIYPRDFEAKEAIKSIISDYNDEVTNAGKEELVIQYTDLVGVMMSSITTIIDTVSYVLVGFVAISLVVSSIMIGIITYISVLERTKEIGILRSIGASKGDISMVFNAETMIIGLSAGILGIIVTQVLAFLISNSVKNVMGISGIASLPWGAAAILVLISVGLTLLAGLIPSRVAANKDPVSALRSE